MNHYTKIFLGVVLVASAFFSASSFAENAAKKAVLDGYGNPIKSSLPGQCVRTKWNVGSDICAPEQEAKPVAVQAPQPKEVVKEHKRSYITFFDYNRSFLPPEGKDIVRTLFESTQSASSTEFTLTGHADRVGSNAYNLMLSKKRALSVRSELINLGVPSDAINVNWKGEAEPLVPTRDGIKEPQNRRVEIKVTTKIIEK